MNPVVTLTAHAVGSAHLTTKSLIAYLATHEQEPIDDPEASIELLLSTITSTPGSLHFFEYRSAVCSIMKMLHQQLLLRVSEMKATRSESEENDLRAGYSEDYVRDIARLVIVVGTQPAMGISILSDFKEVGKPPAWLEDYLDLAGELSILSGDFLALDMARAALHGAYANPNPKAVIALQVIQNKRQKQRGPKGTSDRLMRRLVALHA